MAESNTSFVCQACGAKTPRWVGKCPVCDAWSTMVEEVEQRADARPAWGAGSVQGKPVPLREVKAEA